MKLEYNHTPIATETVSVPLRGIGDETFFFFDETD